MNPQRSQSGQRSRLRLALFVVAGLFPLLYVVLAAVRLGYPYELEWVEGGNLMMVHRLLEGRPLYAAPSLEYVPFNYTPLYYWVSAAFARAFGEGFLALRVVSLLASIGCGLLIWALVARYARSRAAPWLATCLFFATWRLSGAWLDLARVDSLQLVLVLGGAWVLQRDRSQVRGPLLASVVFTLAFLAKQSTAVMLLPVGLYMLIRDRPRAFVLGLGVGLLGVGSVLALNARSGGWFGYYVFHIAGSHNFGLGLATVFWTQRLIAPLGIAIVIGMFAAVAPAERAEPLRPGRGEQWALCAGLVLSAWMVGSFTGASDNLLVPACAAVAMAFGLGWDATIRVAESSADRAPRMRGFVTALALAQFVSLLYLPLRQLPTARDAKAGAWIVDQLRAASGEVLVPCHPYLVRRAGGTEHFHEMSFMDVIRSGPDSSTTRLMQQLRDALRGRRWAAVVLDNRDWLADEVQTSYAPRSLAIPSNWVFWPLTGMRRRPMTVYVPKPDSAVARIGGMPPGRGSTKR